MRRGSVLLKYNNWTIRRLAPGSILDLSILLKSIPSSPSLWHYYSELPTEIVQIDYPLFNSILEAGYYYFLLSLFPLFYIPTLHFSPFPSLFKYPPISSYYFHSSILLSYQSYFDLTWFYFLTSCTAHFQPFLPFLQEIRHHFLFLFLFTSSFNFLSSHFPFLFFFSN